MAWFQVSFYSACLGRTTDLQVILPAEPNTMVPAKGCYKVEKPAYPTLYLLHGFTGNSSDWLLNARVSELSQILGLAIVMPSGDNGFYSDQPASGVLGGSYISKELVEFTRRIFPLSHKREDTIISGLSMGGFGTFINALKFPEVFGHAIGLSGPSTKEIESTATPHINAAGVSRGTFSRLFGDIDRIYGSEYDLLKLAKDLLESGRPIPDFYFACGYNDFLSRTNREFHHDLEAIGFPHTYEEGPGAHDWEFWYPFLRRGLARAMGKSAARPKSPFWVENYDPAYDVTNQGKEGV